MTIRRAVSHLIGLLFMMALTSAAAAQTGERRIVTTPDSDYFGFDLRTEKDVSLDTCQSVCLGDPACRAFTYNTSAEWCFLKSDFSLLNPFAGAVAGKVVAIAGEPDIGAPPALDFAAPRIRDEARQYRSALLREVPIDADFGLQQLTGFANQALADNNGPGAVENLRRALAIAPDNGGLWLRLSRAALIAEGQDRRNSWRLKQAATSAAYNAYVLTRHTGQRARSLAILAVALERREMYRPALNAYQASLALAENPKVLAQYENLKARKGFRVVDHTIDSDSRTPRMCVQFSEALVKSGVDYNRFVAVDGRTAESIDVQDRQICVEGLEHGHRYRVAVRAGLPAAIGEIIESPVNLDIYVRDRAALARFTGDNFVLPGAGRHGIPVVTVNTGRVDMKLYRVGDRALSRLLADSKFLRQIDDYEADRIADEVGAAVWSGVLETSIEQNREVTTSFPADEALPERKPGIYVLTAAPENDRRDSWNAVATQWFVISDIGLTAISGDDGISVFARSLATAAPLGGVELKLVARNNEVLATTTTDVAGQASFPAGLARGTGGMAPQVVTAEHDGSDFVFLDMGRAGFDLSDRGVEGRAAAGALDILAWTERGIYRAGETVHANALARDGAAEAVDGLPLTFVFLRPDGQEQRRIVSNDPSLGGYAFELPLPDNAMRGAWTMRVHTDPKSPSVAEKTFLVEDFVPDRIEFDLASRGAVIAPGQAATIDVDGRFLYGAPAAGLALEGDVKIQKRSQWDAYDGYRFGLADETTGDDQRIVLDGLPVLDEAGKATFEVQIERPPSTTGLLTAEVSVRLREGSGRAVERTLSVPVRPEGPMIGIAPQFAGEAVPENSQANFRVIAVGPDGSRQALAGARWSLVKILRDYQWYREGTAWKYEPVDYTEQVADGIVDIGTDSPAEVSATVAWGRYRLEVEGALPDGPVSSVEFNAGWYVEAASTNTPDGLEIALDRERYRKGETAKLKISPRFAGEMLVTVGAERILATLTASVPEEGATIDIPVGEDWGAGAYVTATLYRPADNEASRLPMRAIGVKWLSVDPAERKLDVRLDAPAQAAPRQTLEIPVSVDGAAAGEKAFVTIAAVDVGILNLTRYEAPDPGGWYFGQRRLGLDIRDIYGRLIDGSAGVVGRIRSGGDGPGMASEGSPPTEKLVAFHSGIVELDDNGHTVVRFDLPQFNGTVRIMAVAWSKAGVGNAEAEVVVRDAVVITAGLPNFLAPGDAADLRLEFANTDGHDGAYTLAVTATGPLSVPEGLRTIDLAAGARTALTVPVEATGAGEGRIAVALEHADGLIVEQALALPVRPAVLPVAIKMDIPLPADGGSLRLDAGLLDGHLIDGASVSVNVTATNAIDVPGLLMSLDRYPYGCAEQTTSRALPLLYVSELSAAAGLDEDLEVKNRVQRAIYRVLAYQSSSGSFGLWGPGSGDLWLDAYVTDFLTRAREQKYDVPAVSMRQALDNLQNALAYDLDIQSRGTAIAYAFYVLARNRRASAGDLRYYADTRIDAFGSVMARAHLGAALALYGDSERAGRAFGSAYRLASGSASIPKNRGDYGSRLRDNAAMLALAAETKPVPASVPAMIELVTAANPADRNISTQEQAWMLLAARAIEAGAPISLTVDGNAHDGAYSRRLSGAALAKDALVISNEGDADITASVTVIAAPEQPLPAGGNGFSIERTYYSMDGSPANVSTALQNERFVVVLKVVEDNSWPSRVLVSDLLPAGFQIDNPRLVDSAGLSNFSWLPAVQPAHTEFRHDRFVAAFNRDGRSDREFTLAYVVRAVTPGVFAHPAASVEDMYRPEYSARTATGVLSVGAR